MTETEMNKEIEQTYEEIISILNRINSRIGK